MGAILADLAEAARRYLQRSPAEGSPLSSAVHLRMTGRIRLGRGKPWIPLTSEEWLGDSTGFLWRARTNGGMPLSGYDRYLGGHGEMHWRLFRLIPVMNASGEDLTRSARWRFAAEHLLLPSLLLPGANVQWSEDGPNSRFVEVNVDGVPHRMCLHVDPDGMPRKVTMERWGNVETPGGGWQPIPYAVRMEGVFRVDGYSLPHQFRASWWAGTDRELDVAELEIEQADLL